MDKDSLLRFIRSRIEEVGTQKAFAAAHGLSESFVSDVLKGKRDPGGRLLSALKLRRVVVYLPESDNG